MLKLLQNLPGNVVGVIGSGNVSADDYATTLAPAIEAALKKREKIRVLYVLGADFSGFTPGAMWGDMKLGVAHFTAWEKVAVVTDVHWVAGATSMFSFAMPCPVRVFAIKDQAEAQTWIAA